jgi:alpha-tubulin suppressor-like RCC1 family protein
MYAFGRNTSAQLGFGDHRDRASPEMSEKITRVAVMATALATVIVVNTEGLMFVWGGNSRGLFGKNTSDILEPIEITAARGKDIIQVDCTNDSVFAVSRSGDVLIWEKNNELKTIFKNLRVRSVSCGRYHVLAETHDGEFYGYATYLTHQLLPNAQNNGALTKLKVDGAFKFIAGDSFTFVLSDTDRDDDRISTAVVTNNAVQPTQQGSTRRGILSWFKRR